MMKTKSRSGIYTYIPMYPQVPIQPLLSFASSHVVSCRVVSKSLHAKPLSTTHQLPTLHNTHRQRRAGEQAILVPAHPDISRFVCAERCRIQGMDASSRAVRCGADRTLTSRDCHPTTPISCPNSHVTTYPRTRPTEHNWAFVKPSCQVASILGRTTC
ncbi:uncharacterized protein BKA78DRAFT_56554 [Phyllosticta capitalensis]|uniref:uncharacterized protein n=1 Tax=Phyllosticta capitalensis TaxID=121624 RepID=UPI00312D87BF